MLILLEDGALLDPLQGHPAAEPGGGLARASERRAIFAGFRTGTCAPLENAEALHHLHLLLFEARTQVSQVLVFLADQVHEVIEPLVLEHLARRQHGISVRLVPKSLLQKPKSQRRVVRVLLRDLLVVALVQLALHLLPR